MLYCMNMIHINRGHLLVDKYADNDSCMRRQLSTVAFVIVVNVGAVNV